jgi:hypothetical protein
MNIVWVLTFVVNGVLVTEPPSFREACLDRMLQQSQQAQAQCTNLRTGQVLKWVK